MKPGFYTIMAAQFFSSLADNALLVVGIALLKELNAPSAITPLLKFFFTVSYVVLAAFVGAYADTYRKGRVMMSTNGIKITGCLLMVILLEVNPLTHILGEWSYILIVLSYGIIGLGAAAYSPAKYGILTELLPPEQLVVANSWIEGLTVASIILGILLGGVLVSPLVGDFLMELDIPFIDTNIDLPAESAVLVIACIYFMAAGFNYFIPDTGAQYPKQDLHPVPLIKRFIESTHILWNDSLGQISLAVTTLFWGTGATMQFIVLKWALDELNMPLHQATRLQAVVAIGIAVGAIWAGLRVGLKQSLGVLPFGIIMGLAAISMVGVTNTEIIYATQTILFFTNISIFNTQLLLATLLLIGIGGLAGYFVVPMNALLQHRGHILLSAGQSIAVQNFNENLGILLMLMVYSLMIAMDMSINTVIVIYGGFVTLVMILIMRLYHISSQKRDLVGMIGH